MTLIRRAILAVALIAGFSPAMAQVPAAVPALPDTERRTSYSISGSTCACNVNFALYGDSTDYQNWVEVFINGVRYDYNDASHGWAITVPTGTLSTRARPISDAILTFNAVQTGTVQIVGARRPRRTTQFSENAGVPARNLNQVFTDITATLREMWDKSNDVTGRALLSQPGVTLGLLPLPATCQNGFLGFDAAGTTPVCRSSSGTGNVTLPVVDGNFAVFDSTHGLLKDSTYNVNNFPVPFTAAGTGAVVRTAQNKMRDIVSVTDFGAIGDGTTDNASLFQRANDTVAAAGGGTVYVPPSPAASYYRSCSVVHLSANVTFKGLSQSGTKIVPCANNQVVFDKINGAVPTFLENVGLENLSIDALTFTGVTGAKFVKASGVTVQNVTFVATATSADADRGRAFACINCTSTGNVDQAGGQLKIWSSDDADYILNPVVTNYHFYNPGNGMQSAQAIYMRRVLTSSVTGFRSNDLGGKIGILLENDSQGAIFSDMKMANVSFGIVQQNGTGPVIGPSFTSYNATRIDQPTQNAVSLIGGNWTAIKGGDITSSGVVTTKDCFFVGAATTDTSISGVTCQGFNGTGGTFVELGTSVDKVRISDNTVTSVETAVKFNGTPTNVLYTNNSLSSVISITTGTTTGTGNFIWANVGFPISLGPDHGGTGLSFGTSGGILCFTASQIMASSAALAQYGVVYGGGAGACPTATAAGTNGQVFLGVTGGAPNWGTVSGNGTISNTGVFALENVVTAAGPLGSSTRTPILGHDAKGRITSSTDVLIQPAASSITGGAALTKTDDTNVTLTLGGSPASALLAAASITVGWTSTLANSRLAPMATNTIKGNATSGSASPTDLAVGSCSTAASALSWTTNTGFGCNTSINAATLGGATFAAPGAIGGTTPSTGAFTTLTASTSITSPLHIGGSGTTGTQLTLQTTSGVGTTDAFAFKGGNNGATTFATLQTGSLNLQSGSTYSINGTAVLSGSTLGSGVTSSSLTSLGTITSLTATTINAFTLGGTISGGGNQINNVVIGNSTPLAGSFTTASASTSLTSPIHIGGSSTSQALEIRATSGNDTGSARINLTGGNNGASTLATFGLAGASSSPQMAIGTALALQTNMIAGFKGAGTGTTFIGQDPLATSIAGLWMGTGTTPTGSNHTLLADGTNTYINAASGSIFLSIGGGSTIATLTSTGIAVTGAATASTYSQTGALAVGSLPSCIAGTKGARYFVTDSNAASYTAGIGAVVAAGGTTNVPVTCDGTNWRIGANDNMPGEMLRKFA